jgi:hypothetical protein
MRFVLGALLAISVAGASGCQGEPSLLCDRVRLVWPFFNLDPSLDTRPEREGLQIDLALRSSLLPGTSVTLTVQGPEGDPVTHPQAAIASESGDLLFTDVTVPFGRVTLQVNATNECGDTRSTRTPFVWDGLGYPRCDVDLGARPAVVDALAPLGVLRPEHDADPDAPGMQLEVEVDAGRPDMAVTLFALDAASGEQQIFQAESGSDGRALFPVSLGEGEQAVRAVCVWEPGELRPSSPSFRLWVDSQAPDCELVAPAARVRAADDLDPDAEGVQFEVRGRSQAGDVAGQPGAFTVDGEDVAGSAVDEDGESAATATLLVEPGQAQDFSFRVLDHAGNPCEARVSFP